MIEDQVKEQDLKGSGALGVIDRYRAYLPVTEKTPVVTLHEGSTPLVRAPRLEKALGARGIEIYLKIEGMNPTGSFKDRGMTLAVSKALEEKSRAVITASTGNTSASAAAYASRAGMKCVVLIPEGMVALGKLSQSLIAGAEVLAVQGGFDVALEMAKELSGKYPLTLVNSINPYRLEGQKTAAFEIVDALGESPDFQFMPVGNAGNISAYWMGYREYQNKQKVHNLPKLMGFQAEGAAPIVRGQRVMSPETVATAIRIGNPASWKKAEAARDESGGVIDIVTDGQILDAYKLLAVHEGVFVEPASAASVAGLKKYIEEGYFSKISTQGVQRIVCILTGHGLKDPDRAVSEMPHPRSVKATADAVASNLGL